MMEPLTLEEAKGGGGDKKVSQVKRRREKNKVRSSSILLQRGKGPMENQKQGKEAQLDVMRQVDAGEGPKPGLGKGKISKS